MIAVVAAVNVRGTRGSADVQNVTTALKAGAVAVLSLLLLARGGRLFEASPPAPADFNLVTGIGLALVSVLWAYEGWQFVTYSAGETMDPQRNFPRGLAVGTGGARGPLSPGQPRLRGGARSAGRDAGGARGLGGGDRACSDPSPASSSPR